jgi:predicted nuclease with TOPRIM domain
MLLSLIPSGIKIFKCIEMYNDAIETIWYLQERLNELSVENDALWDDYEELSNQLYG